jgi:hypothetical protein
MDNASFDILGYQKISGLFALEAAAELFEYVQERTSSGVLRPDPQVPNAVACYADPLMDQLLLCIQPHIERVFNGKLFPTYSYYRLYRRGDVLRPHRDRKSCEISATVNLGQIPGDPWPIWIRGSQGAHAVELLPGDALVYRGIECEHWREPYAGDSLGQVFLHYVNEQGPYAHWKFDKRSSLNIAGMDSSTSLPNGNRSDHP